MKKWLFIICFLPIHVFAQIITTISGTGIIGFAGDNGPATLASFRGPVGLTIDNNNNIYISDLYNYCIRKIDTLGIITTIAGTGNSGCSGDNGAATAAEFTYSVYIFHYNGKLYIPDEACKLKMVDTNNVIYNIAGNGCDSLYPVFYGDGGMATNACIVQPSGVQVDKKDNILFCDNYSRIRAVDAFGIIHTFAGTNIGFYGDNGPATSAKLNSPGNICFDNYGNLLIADVFNYRIRKIDTNGIITTIAGNGMFGYSGDNMQATDAKINGPQGIAVDGANNIFFADYNNNVIRKIDNNGIITTVVGDGTGGSIGDNGLATAAKLNGPSGIAFDKQGNLYIADFKHERIRKVSNLGIRMDVKGVLPHASLRQMEDVRVFPNPVGSVLNVVGVLEECEISIFDMVGNEQLKVKSEKSKTVIDISGLANGVYIVEVLDLKTGERVVRKVIKE